MEVGETFERERTPTERRQAFTVTWMILVLFGCSIITFVFMGIVWAVNKAASGESPGNNAGPGPGFFVAWAVFSLVSAILLIWWTIRWGDVKPITDFRYKTVGSPGTDYFCELCYYRWHLDPGQSQPPVHLNPSLIAAGEARLRAQAQSNADLLRKQNETEEAEARARRKRDLEWNHWNQ